MDMIFSAVLSASTLLAAQQDQPPMELVEAIRTAHQANRAHITRATMRLRYSVGNATDLASALAGRWTERSDADCLFVLDGTRARYDRLFDPEVMREKRRMTGALSSSTRVSSVRVVTDGRVTLSDYLFIAPPRSGEEVLTRQVRIDEGTDPNGMNLRINPCRPRVYIRHQRIVSSNEMVAVSGLRLWFPGKGDSALTDVADFLPE